MSEVVQAPGKADGGAKLLIFTSFFGISAVSQQAAGFYSYWHGLQSNAGWLFQPVLEQFGTQFGGTRPR